MIKSFRWALDNVKYKTKNQKNQDAKEPKRKKSKENKEPNKFQIENLKGP